MPEPGEGGVGHSWFVVDLTSENVPTTWFMVELTSDHVDPGEPPPALEKQGGSSGEQVYGGGPWMHEFEFRRSGQVDLRKEVELRPTRGSITAIAHPVVEIRKPGSFRTLKEVQFVHKGQRTPAHQWSRLLREDEEILLSL